MALEALNNSEAGLPTTPAAPASTEQHDGAEAIVAQPAGEQQQQQSSHAEVDEVAQQNSRDDETPTPTLEPAPAPAPKAETNLCGVCQTNAPKYKCPRCRLPYCSVACNKIHRENHPPDPEPQPPQKEPVVQSNKAPAEQIDPANPFRALETSDKLKLLFKKYPNLPNQLLEIHAATQPPTEAPGSKTIPASLMQGLPKKDNWNHDIGMKNGKAALRKARKAGGEAGEAIREYTELILHIMNEAGRKEDAAVYLQQQAAEEDTKLIERLMAEEQRKR